MLVLTQPIELLACDVLSVIQSQPLRTNADALARTNLSSHVSDNRYKAGVEQYLDVIVAQAVELTHKQNAVQLNGQRLAASVSLIKALGAGWQPTSTASGEQ
jgi:multidrug efflux system outer membrane protein